MHNKSETFELWQDLRTLFLQPLTLFQESAPSSKRLLQIMFVGLLGYAIFGLSAASLHGGRSFFLTPLLFPMIFFGALCIGMPALYIFDSYLGSRLRVQHILRIALIALVLPGITLAGMAPINWFFVISMRSPLMVTITSGLAIAFSAVLAYNQIFDLLQHLDPTSASPKESSTQNTSSNAQNTSSNASTSPEKSAIIEPPASGDLPNNPPSIAEPPPSTLRPTQPILPAFEVTTRGQGTSASNAVSSDASQQLRRNVRYAWLLLYLGVLYKLMVLLLPLSGLTQLTR